MPVIDRDNGFRELVARVRGAPPTEVKVGVPDTPRDDDTPNDEIAIVHEFGLGHVPQRSFIRAWVDENEHGIRTKLGQVAAAATVRREISWGDAMKQFAAYCARGMRDRIRRNIPPPLADETVRRKGSSLALVETEQMINSIASEITYEGQAPVSALETAETLIGADPLADTVVAVDPYADTELPE
jgi:hypothetical protein